MLLLWKEKTNPKECGKMWGMCAQSCPTLCDPVDCSPPDSSACGIFQAIILERVAISSSRGSSWSRAWTHIPCISCTGRQILYYWYNSIWKFRVLFFYSSKLFVVAHSLCWTWGKEKTAHISSRWTGSRGWGLQGQQDVRTQEKQKRAREQLQGHLAQPCSYEASLLTSNCLARRKPENMTKNNLGSEGSPVKLQKEKVHVFSPTLDMRHLVSPIFPLFSTSYISLFPSLYFHF